MWDADREQRAGISACLSGSQSPAQAQRNGADVLHLPKDAEAEGHFKFPERNSTWITDFM